MCPADSVVIFTCCGTYSNSTLVTSHKMQFSGSVGFNYGTTSSLLTLASTLYSGPLLSPELDEGPHIARLLDALKPLPARGTPREAG